ncbi:uncharacterized protein LOC100827806 isoform X2 [Brachypodium distachyon]|uniref:uncharacterized protein LOC100827806 isoform X2 n=1 Tax=Brachypodium distachyon TaxID=15368 RepID=UPI000D0D6F3F|nr:uncharacterized protein LOC100827806 isoform X2 [Brachypodium distachyon]|eukprot:XP_024310909.1 uncharacterized protein LOC100827806 isoform X2 [Brachypodium distachyon]
MAVADYFVATPSSSPSPASSRYQKVLSSGTDEYHVNTLKDVGLKIIKICGGLPLAIKVMGGLLRQREMHRRDWEQVLDNSDWSTTKMPEDLNNAVYLSYQDMPPYLKQCFLFYALLPKSTRFDVLHVVGMWISEGFIHGNHSDLEETGRNYYKELISRNLIEPDNKSYFEQWFCSMHDVVRSFGQYIARKEALIAHNGEIDTLTKLNSQKFLRLSIETSQLQSGELHWKSLQEQESVRTLISTIPIEMKPGDSLVTFSSLRTLYIESADVALLESLHKLKHMRYLTLVNTSISALPENIGKMKLLQFIDLSECNNLVDLPNSIVKLSQLRYLNLPSNGSIISRGFCGLTNMRILGGFPALVDGDWCSLDELGPLSHLRFLRLEQLENVSTASSAANVRLGEKIRLTKLLLGCTSKLGYDGLVRREDVSAEEQQRIEMVFNQLCPPSSVEYINISGYFGQQHPSWMMSMPTVPLNNLKFLLLCDVACCNQLPSGLCQLPCLQELQVRRAPCIKRVGTEFLHSSQPVAAAFPRLNKMVLKRMVEWEEWEWEEQVQAMPCLEELLLKRCKLRLVPPGLASQARALRKLSIKHVKQLTYLENCMFVVDLTVDRCPDLERITDLPKLQKLTIIDCPKLKVLNGVPQLDRVVLEDYTMEELPEYVREIKPRHLQVFCRLWLLASVATGQSGIEWDKFSHVEYVKSYARDGDNRRKWYVLYTRGNCKLESNISRSTVFQETLSSSMIETQRFEHLYKMKITTFDYVCSLVRVPFLEDMMARDHRFADGRVLCLQDRVAVALRMLNSGEPPETVGSSLGMNKSIVLLITKSFVDAMWEKAMHHLDWPGSNRIENIKYKFDKIHGLPNCCGVVHTDHITFESQNSDHEVNAGMLMQAVVDTDMRFTNIWLGSSSNMNQSSILHDSVLFKHCEKDTWLNGSKLNLSDGRQVGEYIIGDAGFPLLPWLLTSFQENDLSDYQVEFNRRHSQAMTITLTKALAKLKDTWKFLHGGVWRPENQFEPMWVIYACCMLHNIVIDKECGTGMGSYQKVNYSQQVHQLVDEDPVMVRDVLSQHLTSKPLEPGGTLSIFEDAQTLESVLKMPRRTFNYVCGLLKESSLEIMNDYFFFDMRLFSLEERVAIALIMLNSGDPPATVGSFIGVNESTVPLVTKSFVDAMLERAQHHLRWPQSDEMEKMKSMFDEIHGLPNCCGVLHTTHVTSASRSWDHFDKDSFVLQGVIAPDMRFTSIWVAPRPANTSQSSFLHDSNLFEYCEKGAWLNGSKLKVASEEVGEYVIGDVGYPLLPWLLTPYYQLQNDLSDIPYQVEFNSRHSAVKNIALKVLARLEGTWKSMHGEWRPDTPREMSRAIHACCILHNIVIDIEEDAGMPSDQEEDDSKQKRQLEDEDAVRARDVLSEYMTSRSSESRVDEVDQEVQHRKQLHPVQGEKGKQEAQR